MIDVFLGGFPDLLQRRIGRGRGTACARKYRVRGVCAVAAREVREETGLVVSAGAVVGRIRIESAAVVYDVVDLACSLTTPDQVPVAGDDAADVRFADAVTLAGLQCTPGLVETLREWGVLPG